MKISMILSLATLTLVLTSGPAEGRWWSGARAATKAVVTNSQQNAIRDNFRRYKDLKQHSRGRYQRGNLDRFKRQRVYKLTTPILRRKLTADAAIARLEQGKQVRAVPMKSQIRSHLKKEKTAGHWYYGGYRYNNHWSYSMKLRRSGSTTLSTSKPKILTGWLEKAAMAK